MDNQNTFDIPNSTDDSHFYDTSICPQAMIVNKECHSPDTTNTTDTTNTNTNDTTNTNNTTDTNGIILDEYSNNDLVQFLRKENSELKYRLDDLLVVHENLIRSNNFNESLVKDLMEKGVTSRAYSDNQSSLSPFDEMKTLKKELAEKEILYVTDLMLRDDKLEKMENDLLLGKKLIEDLEKDLLSKEEENLNLYNKIKELAGRNLNLDCNQISNSQIMAFINKSFLDMKPMPKQVISGKSISAPFKLVRLLDKLIPECYNNYNLSPKKFLLNKETNMVFLIGIIKKEINNVRICIGCKHKQYISQFVYKSFRRGASCDIDGSNFLYGIICNECFSSDNMINIV